MATILSGDATAAQLIAFVVALRAKGETPEELSGLLDAVLDAATIVPLGDDLRRGPSTSSAPAAIAAIRSTSARWRPSSSPVPACRSASTVPGPRRRSAAPPTCSRSWAWRSSCRQRVCCAASRRWASASAWRRKFHPAFRFAAPSRREDRHRHGVQPARADGQPGARAPPADRRRQPGGRRADAGLAAPAWLRPGVGRARQRSRRADHHWHRRPCWRSTTTTSRTFTVDPVALGFAPAIPDELVGGTRPQRRGRSARC